MTDKFSPASHPSEIPDDFDLFMKAIRDMDPQEAQILIKNMIEDLKEDGEDTPFILRLLTTQAIFGVCETPVGLVYGVSGLDQLLLTGFIVEEDIEEMGSVDDVLQIVVEDLEENMVVANTRRDDAAISAMIQKALDGTYEITSEVLDALDGSDLQLAVWQELIKIPYGTTLSYEELALRIGKPKAVRAVATAVGENPLSIAIPCHRVILKSGSIGEYHWGSDIKAKLLSYEKNHRQA